MAAYEAKVAEVEKEEVRPLPLPLALRRLFVSSCAERSV